jgi:general secretion pathway protein K
MLKSQKGVVLVITLLITAILVGTAVELVYGVYISATRTNNFKNGQRASILAWANAGLKEFLIDKKYVRITQEGLTFNHVEGDGAVAVKIFDEQGKTAIKIVYPTGEEIRKANEIYRRLLKNLKLEDSLADTLSDWLDTNDEPRMGGAEGADYYQRLPYPYQPKNGSPDSLEELLMIKGYTYEVYKKLSPFVTPYTDGSININTADKKALMSLSDEINEELAQSIMDYRKDTPFTDVTDINKVPGFETLDFKSRSNIQSKITVQSSIFRVYSRAVISETVREVEAVIRAGGDIIYWREM